MPDAARLSADRARVAAAYVLALLVAVLVGSLLARGTLVGPEGSATWTTHPITVAAAADVTATLIVFAFSLALDNSSVYDPYWSLAPIPIVAYWAFAGARGGRAGIGTLQRLPESPGPRAHPHHRDLGRASHHELGATLEGARG